MYPLEITHRPSESTGASGKALPNQTLHVGPLPEANKWDMGLQGHGN